MRSELSQRIWFTLGALLVYRLGTYVPLPGIDPTAWAQVFRSQSGGMWDIFNALSRGGTQPLSIFALGILPYLSAGIFIQLLTIPSRKLKALKKQGERGRRKIGDYTRYLTILLTFSQAYAIAAGLEGVTRIVTDPGWLFRLSTALTLTGGTIFLVWLSEQITLRGIGNGIALIFLVGIFLALPEAVATTLVLGRQGAVSSDLILAACGLMVALTALIVVMERGQRRLLVTYPRRQVGTRAIEGQSHLSVKLNSAGMIPAILASYLMPLPTTLAIYAAGQDTGWWSAIVGQHGRPLFMTFYAVLIVCGVLFYTAFVFGPEEAAENLKIHGGLIPGIEPGEATVEHLDYVLSRTTMLGAAYLVLVCLVPEFLIAYTPVPFYLGGTSLLIVVCALVDIDAQVKATRSSS